MLHMRLFIHRFPIEIGCKSPKAVQMPKGLELILRSADKLTDERNKLSSNMKPAEEYLFAGFWNILRDSPLGIVRVIHSVTL